MRRRIWELMNSDRLFILLLVVLLLPALCSEELKGQHPVADGTDRGDIRIMFYNVENYFDTVDNPHTRDEEFLPQSEKMWNGYKYYIKTQLLFKTIVATGGMRPPEIIGLAEIENEGVLRHLLYTTGLMKFSYGILQFDSPDLRGIDVGILYRNDLFTLIDGRPIPVRFPDNPARKTRDILYAKLSYLTGDTLHLFVNHWPSRRGGKTASEPFRMHVAGILRHKADSILSADSCSRILIMGDFNDNPEDRSVREELGAVKPTQPIVCNLLYSMLPATEGEIQGTYRYRAAWERYDQMILSGALLDSTSSLYAARGLQIAGFSFLVEEDNTYGGLRPRRTYLGPVYKGGFSDHLPVYIDLFVKSVP